MASTCLACDKSYQRGSARDKHQAECIEKHAIYQFIVYIGNKPGRDWGYRFSYNPAVRIAHAPTKFRVIRLTNKRRVYQRIQKNPTPYGHFESIAALESMMP